jgi:hypothetical protein
MADVRGEGGYIVAPPSAHPCGRAYAWSVDSGSEFVLAPDWLLAVVGDRKARAPIPTAPERWRTFVDEFHQGSHRGGAIARLSGHLLRRYVDPLVVLSLCRQFNELRCDPPLDDAEVVRVVNDIAAREADRRKREEENGNRG